MLKVLENESLSFYLGQKLRLCPGKIVCDYTVVDEKNGNSGALFRYPQSNLFAIYTGFGTVCSCDQKEATKIAGFLKN